MKYITPFILMEKEEPQCKVCERTGVTLTSEGLCFACLAKKYATDDDDAGTWFNKA